MHKLPIQKPSLGKEEIDAVTEPLQTGWVAQGPKVKQFEQAVAEYTGAAHAVAATSCTTALHLALHAAGVGPGDEVVIPALTFVATANAAEALGAKVVFCDVDPVELIAGAAHMEPAVTPRTKVLIPVSLFGRCCAMDEINQLAASGRMLVLEDAACSLGAWQGSIHAGSQAWAAAFSFHPRKVITTGEGGMLITNDELTAEKLRCLRDHGAVKTDFSRHVEKGGFLLSAYENMGFNYRMTDIQGAIGLAQMGKLKSILKARREVASWYLRELEDLDWLVLPRTDPHETNFQSFVTLISPGTRRLADPGRVDELGKRRNKLMARLEAEGVSTRQGTHAVHILGYYSKKYNLRANDFPNAYMADRLSLTLPLYQGMTREDVVVVKELLKKHWPLCAG